MTGARRRVLRRFLGFLCLLLVSISALGLLGWPPTRRWAGEDGVWAMWIGLAVSLVASLIGALPIVLAERRGSAEAQDMLASLATRFLVALFGILYVILSGFAARTPFLIWVGIGYLALLPIDVHYALRSRNPPSGAQGRTGLE